MMRKLMCATVLLAAFAVAAFALETRISRLDTWELDFSCKPPRVLEVTEGETVLPYTYIIYQVTNNSGQVVDFYPTFEIEADEGEKTYSDGIFPKIYERIASTRSGQILPFTKMKGTIEPGDTRRGVAIFRNVDPGADKLTVYVTGLSGDMKIEETDGELVAMYRTYKLVYLRPGDEFVAELDPVKLESTTWLWR